MLEQFISEHTAGLNLIAQMDIPLLQQKLDWQTKYRLLMQLGKKLPPLPESLRKKEYLIPGCESQAWLFHYQDPNNHKHYFVMDSEARIVKGLLAILLAMVNAQTSTELQSQKLEQDFDALGLRPYLSQSRSNGLNQMFLKIKTLTSLNE